MTLLLQPGYEALGHIKVDIFGIPAIGADPTKAFIVDDQPWFPTLYQNIPNARVFLYDHLTPEERAIEVKPRSHAFHQASTERFAEIEDELAQYGLDEWADRFLGEISRARDAKGLDHRPVIFICHSTGGLVLKQALCMKMKNEGEDIASTCIGITFFATPHRGSSVLAKQEFSRAIQDNLYLKWEMSNFLRSQLTLENYKLELLNHNFGSRALGIPIWNYIETIESTLKVLTESAGEMLTKVRMKIVDPQSAEISNGLMNSLVEAEEFNLNTTHIGTARLADDRTLYDDYREALRKLVQSTNAQERKSHHELITSIKNELKVDLHQFYQVNEPSSDSVTTGVWSEQASLAALLDSGISQALQKRLNSTESPTERKISLSKPLIEVRGVSEPHIDTSNVRSPPEISVQQATASLDDLRLGRRLQAPQISMSESINTRRPSPTRSQQTQYGQRSSSPLRTSLQLDTSFEHHPQNRSNLQTREPAPQRAHTFQTPSKTRDKFQWIHVPACVPGLVPKIMAAIEKDKSRPNLHKKVLMDANWLSNHNKSRHASSHARFVRSFFKLLMPKGITPQDEILSPISASQDPQMALYMPYMHWDTFSQLKARSDILKRRRDLKSARPIDRKVLLGKSLEHKIIWQFLNLGSSSVHCRRTLDQYGYPSLRDIEARDNDQVMYKKTKPAKAPDPPPLPARGHRERRKRRHERKQIKTLDSGTACVLMVDQLWCWVLAEDLIVTFFAPEEKGEDDNGSHLQADILTNIRKAVNGDYAVHVEDCYDFAALIVSHSVKALLENGDPSLQVFRIFEEYISELTEDQVKSFKQFRDGHRVEEVSVRKGNPLAQFLDNSKDLNNLLELRDIEDELTTIKRLLNEQQKIVADMLKQYKYLNETTGKGRLGTSFLMDLDRTLETYEEQVDGMLQSSDIAQESYSQLLDMKQKHSNIIEAHLAREQTETAAEQSRSVMIFTIVTIIFLPLSFFSSVFGMNVYEWSDQPTNPPLSYVVTVMGCVSLGVIIVALLAAFNSITRRVLVKISKFTWLLFVKPVDKIFGLSRRSSNLSKIATWDTERGMRLSFPGAGWMHRRGGEKGNRWKERLKGAVENGNIGPSTNGLVREAWGKEE